jgi:uncharacterized phiE125 gp8 family phage protein
VTASILVTPPAIEPLTLDEAKLRAGQEWVAGDPRDALMLGNIRAARAYVENDTGLALLTQTRDIYLDRVTGPVLRLPEQSRPLQSVTSIKTTDTAGVQTTLAPGGYVVDLATARIYLASGGAWPCDGRLFLPWTIRIVSGWASVALIPPDLFQAVALMTAHLSTFGRDVLQVGHIVATTPLGYEDLVAPYRVLTLA